MTFWPCDPKWPQSDIWPHDIGRRPQADAHMWVLGSCYLTRTHYIIFSENNHLTLVTPKWPQIDISLTLKLIHVYESYGHAMEHGWVVEFLSENDILTPVTPNEPRLIFEPIG